MKWELSGQLKNKGFVDRLRTVGGEAVRWLAGESELAEGGFYRLSGVVGGDGEAEVARS